MYNYIQNFLWKKISWSIEKGLNELQLLAVPFLGKPKITFLKHPRHFPSWSTIRIRILFIQSDWNMQVVVMMNLKSYVFWPFYHSRAEPPISFPVFSIMFEFLFRRTKISSVIFCFTHQGIPMWFRPVIKGSNSVFYFKNINKPENAKTDSIKRKIIIGNVILQWGIRWSKALNEMTARSYIRRKL